MKLNTSSGRKVRRWLAAAGFFLCLLGTTVPVFAEEETTVATQTEAGTETKQDEKTTVPEKTETKAETDPVKEMMLPTGNLTLVDDVISAADGHREFLTVMSREGSYFYIVIDRDSQGAGNVYFLNLVDEQDLYKLTGEETPEVLEPEAGSQIILEPQMEVQKENGSEKEDLSEEETAAQKQKSLMITVGVGAAIVVGVVIYLLKKKKNKKQAQAEFDLSDFDDDDE